MPLDEGDWKLESIHNNSVPIQSEDFIQQPSSQHWKFFRPLETVMKRISSPLDWESPNPRKSVACLILSVKMNF